MSDIKQVEGGGVPSIIVGVASSDSVPGNCSSSSDRLDKLGLAEEEPSKITFEEALEMCVGIVCDGLTVVPDEGQDNLDKATKGMLVTIDGNVGIGKTTLIADCIKHSIKTAGRLAVAINENAPKDITALFYTGRKNKLKNGGRNTHAALAQMFFSMQRALANLNASAMAGYATDYGWPHASWGAEVKDVYTDRSRIGDPIFILANWLEDDIDDDSLRALVAAFKAFPVFKFGVAVYLDGKSETARDRNEARAKANPERAHEAGIDLGYFHKLRLLHYILLRKMAMRGAPVLVLDNTTYLTGEQLFNAIHSVPERKAIGAIWASSPDLAHSATPTELDSAFAKVIAGYALAGRGNIKVSMNGPMIETRKSYAGVLSGVPDNIVIPYIELIIAGMRGGKSTEVIRLAGVYEAANKKVAMVKHRIETRYNAEAPGESPQVVTHSGLRYTAISVPNLTELKLNKGDFDVVIIDEAQFFGKELIPYMLKNHWFHFVVAGLPAYSNLKPFGQVAECVCLASSITHLKGVCQTCGKINSAAFSPALKHKKNDIEVGTHYGTACNECWTRTNVH